MYKDKLKEPSFIAASIACLLLIWLVIIHPGLSPANPSGNGPQKTDQSTEVDEALSKATEHLGNKNFALAYDFLLVASRLSASDTRLFEAVLKFIEQANGSKDDEVVALAEDLLDRGDSLVHFQSPKLVESARKSLEEMREKFPSPQKTTEPEPKSEPIRRLIKISADASLPVELRTKVVEQARNALDEAWIDSVASKNQGDLKPEEIKQLWKQMEEAEKRCVAELFERYTPSAAEWLKASQELIDESKTPLPGALPAISEKVRKAIALGMDRLQEILPYAKSEVKGAQELSANLEKQVAYLQRLKTWYYNLATLRLIRDIEANKKRPSMEKVKMLAGISEELLSPYVMQRFGELWNLVFDSLGNEDEKVTAMMLRILRASK